MLKTIPLLIALVFFLNPAQAQGIDCAKASTLVDKAICASPELQKQDNLMALLYDSARINMFGAGPSGEVSAQKKWLVDREKCANNKVDGVQKCLLDFYTARNLTLAYSALPTAPELSLQVLRDQKVESQQIFEALTLFASEPDGTDWSKPALAQKQTKIMELVQPFFDGIAANTVGDKPNGHFAVELFSDTGLSKPADILKSSHDFAGFFRAATYDTDATLPCGFIVSHQDLMEATNGYFGATPDNFIIRSNCATSAPITPKFNTLVDKIWKSWPECQGTIRFAAYGSFNVAVDKALSPSARTIDDFKIAAKPQAPKGQHKLLGVGPSTINAAQSELTAYYAKYLKISPAKSAIFAKAKLADVLADAQQCD